jgi:hypothetical protein
VFAAAVAVAYAAGRISVRRDGSSDDGGGDAPEEKCGPARTIALAVGLAAIVATWVLQARPYPPRFVLATWAIALVAIPLAFPATLRPRGEGVRRTWSGWTVALAAFTFAVAAWARLFHLDGLPPVFSGDEANQVADAENWLGGPAPTDPFGTGWIGTIRLGMLPAGTGALARPSSPVAGPRLPYAIAGTLSVAAAGVAAALAAGPIGAVGFLAFLALAPHHVHFSRLASVQVLDSFFAAVTVALLFATRRAGSARLAAYTGVAAGLSLYGYTGGRVVPALFLAGAFFLAFDRRRPAQRRRWLALALAAGFAAAAGPNLRFAVHHFADWNSRFNQVSIFQEGWLPAETQRLGSLSRVAANQLESGTLGLLYGDDYTSWFTRYPLVGPAILVGAALAGLGWLAGRRSWFEAMVIGLLVAGNLAGVVLTSGAPSAQRVSSLLPGLAILAGTAFAGLAAFVPKNGAGGVPWRAAAVALTAGVLLATQIRGYPIDWEPYAGYGGPHAALAQRAADLLRQERFRGRPVYLHGWKFVDSSFPGFHHFLSGTRFIDDDPQMSGYTEQSFPPGIHLFSVEWLDAAKEWRGRLGLAHGIALAHPAYPARDIGYVFVVPRSGTH